MDPSVAPAGHGLIQVSAGMPPGTSIDDANGRIEALLDVGFPGWRGAEAWRRRTAIECSSGAIDPVGVSWKDRPAIEQGDGIYLVGDAVAAAGMLSEVVHQSALEATARLLAS